MKENNNFGSLDQEKLAGLNQILREENQYDQFQNNNNFHTPNDDDSVNAQANLSVQNITPRSGINIDIDGFRNGGIDFEQQENKDEQYSDHVEYDEAWTNQNKEPLFDVIKENTKNGHDEDKSVHSAISKKNRKPKNEKVEIPKKKTEDLVEPWELKEMHLMGFMQHQKHIIEQMVRNKLPVTFDDIAPLQQAIKEYQEHKSWIEENIYSKWRQEQDKEMKK